MGFIIEVLNLDLRCKCEMVFPAGVGPDSPSRDANNWGSQRFSRSVETRRRFDWLRMMFIRCNFLPRSDLGPFRRWWHARGKRYCRGKSGRAPQHT